MSATMRVASGMFASTSSIRSAKQRNVSVRIAELKKEARVEAPEMKPTVNRAVISENVTLPCAASSIP